MTAYPTLFSTALLAALLSACMPAVPSPAPGVSETSMSSARSSASSSAENSSAHAALPSELTIEAFARMPLSGTGFTLEHVERDEGVYKRYAITYTSNGLRISGILNVPRGEGPFPLAVLNHGYIAPSIYTRGRGLKREQDGLARRGFVVLHADYRGHAASDPSPDTERRAYDAGLEYSVDVINGIRALCDAKSIPVDCTRIGMLGHSMGGGVTLNIAVAYPDLVDRIALYAPVSGKAWKNFDRWRRERDTDDRTLEVFGSDEENADAWMAISSWSFFDRISVPVLVFQGGRDKDVPKEWSDELIDRLQTLGKEVTYVEYPAEGHEFATQWNDFLTKTAEFFAGEE